MLPSLPLGRPADGRQSLTLPYTASSEHDALVTTFTWWNQLDGLQSAYVPHKNAKTAPGHLIEVQLRRMMQLARLPNVRHYCEVGMNVGHSTVAMLLANPQLHAHTFDVMRFNYSRPAAELLQRSFGDRFTVHEGKSSRTVPAWSDGFLRDGNRCQLMFVDGAHTRLMTRTDLLSFEPVAANASHVVVDDISIMNGPGQALEDMVAMKRLQISEIWGPFPKFSLYNPTMWSKGFAVAQYTHPGRPNSISKGSYSPRPAAAHRRGHH